MGDLLPALLVDGCLLGCGARSRTCGDVAKPDNVAAGYCANPAQIGGLVSVYRGGYFGAQPGAPADVPQPGTSSDGSYETLEQPCAR